MLEVMKNFKLVGKMVEDLEEIGVLDIFMKNVEKEINRGVLTLESICTSTEKEETKPYLCMRNFFIFSESKEGIKYWLDVKKKMKQL